MPLSLEAESKGRTPAQIREHYEIERALATQLRQAPRSERLELYGRLYDELFRRVTHHPGLLCNRSSENRPKSVTNNASIIRRYLPPQGTFLEVGPGDCRLACEIARHAKRVLAVDVSEEITTGNVLPDNLTLVLSDGVSIDVMADSVDVAYSDQLMEHLHPEDAMEQLRGIYDALKPGGVYICITPNRLSGPHDISKFFDDVATGFHLREYTVTELARFFRDVGFDRIRARVGMSGRSVYVPLLPISMLELSVKLLGLKAGRYVVRSRIIKPILGVCLIARKPRKTTVAPTS